MIDHKLAENIRKYGVFKDSGEGRRKVLIDDIGFRMDKRAEYVLIGGCLQPQNMPQAFQALKDLLELLKVDYTMLAREYCCGWVPLGQPAVMAKNEADIAQAKEIAREFVVANFQQAESLGARSLALFCGACEPHYSNYRRDTKLEVISCAELIDRHFKGGRLAMKADFYSGCYRFRRRLTSEPLDITPATRVLSRIEGLQVNHLDSNLCCFIPPHLEQLLNSLTSDTIITICTGCHGRLTEVLKKKGNYRVKMLPEIALAAASK